MKFLQRCLLASLYVFLFCGNPAAEGKKLPQPVPDATRKLAAVSPASTRVLTVSCNEQSGNGDQALAIALMATDDSGAFSMSLYVKPSGEPYSFKQISGKATTVPEGLVFRAANWLNSSAGTFFLHAHPHDLTSFPGANGRFQCRLTGDMKP